MYKQLEVMSCDLSAFPACKFFRVEVWQEARITATYILEAACAAEAGCVVRNHPPLPPGHTAHQSTVNHSTPTVSTPAPIVLFFCNFPQAIIRPWRLQKVVAQLAAHGIRGLTVSSVQGAGVQGGEYTAVFSSTVPPFWSFARAFSFSLVHIQ